MKLTASILGILLVTGIVILTQCDDKSNRYYELDGKILTDDTGKEYKFEFSGGRLYVREKVILITSSDTVINWKLIDDNTIDIK